MRKKTLVDKKLSQLKAKMIESKRANIAISGLFQLIIDSEDRTAGFLIFRINHQFSFKVPDFTYTENFKPNKATPTPCKVPFQTIKANLIASLKHELSIHSRLSMKKSDFEKSLKKGLFQGYL